DQRQGFTGITGVVREGGAADAARFVFPPDADEKRMQPGRLGRLKHGHRTGARRDHPAISEPDPLASVLIDELVAYSPPRRLVLAPSGVDWLRDLWRQLVGDALHRSPQNRWEKLFPTFYRPSVQPCTRTRAALPPVAPVHRAAANEAACCSGPRPHGRLLC